MNGLAGNSIANRLGDAVQAAPTSVAVLIDRNLEAASKLHNLLVLLWGEMHQNTQIGAEKPIPPRAGLDGKLLDISDLLDDAGTIANNMRGYLTGN